MSIAPIWVSTTFSSQSSNSFTRLSRLKHSMTLLKSFVFLLLLVCAHVEAKKFLGRDLRGMNGSKSSNGKSKSKSTTTMMIPSTFAEISAALLFSGKCTLLDAGAANDIQNTMCVAGGGNSVAAFGAGVKWYCCEPGVFPEDLVLTAATYCDGVSTTDNCGAFGSTGIAIRYTLDPATQCCFVP